MEEEIGWSLSYFIHSILNEELPSMRWTGNCLASRVDADSAQGKYPNPCCELKPGSFIVQLIALLLY